MSTSSHAFTVILDPGHGGKDVGCQGRFANEKSIVLDVATQVKSLIHNQVGDSISVILTRDDDTFIPLQKRADIANNAKGDLFVSIHVNSVDAKSKGRNKISGASVYALGLNKVDNNLQVAMRENAVIELEDNHEATYQGFDPNSSESYIIFELNRDKHIAHSLDFASTALSELTSTAARNDKGVRQAGFWVLWATSMPAALVELDFICNPDAENFLVSSKGKKQCATAIKNAIIKYYNKHKRFSNASIQSLSK